MGLALIELDTVPVQQIIIDVKTDEGVQAVLSGNNTMTNNLRGKVSQDALRPTRPGAERLAMNVSTA